MTQRQKLGSVEPSRGAVGKRQKAVSKRNLKHELEHSSFPVHANEEETLIENV